MCIILCFTDDMRDRYEVCVWFCFVTGGPSVLYYVEQEPNPQLKGNCFVISVYINIPWTECFI